VIERGWLIATTAFFAVVVVSLAVVLAVAGLAQLDDLDETRALRLLEVRERLPRIVWAVLIVGGVITFSFTFLFWLETAWLHMLAVAALTVVLSLILYTIAVLEYPFNSSVPVEPDAFGLVLDGIGEGSN
jgi:hypothetical protein